jgi:DNA-binding MarR family transcriptional regulator
MLDDIVFEIQRLYPQIYLACHIDHVRASSTNWRLSSHDSSILAHLDLRNGISPRTLAAHLSIVPSTLSASLARLVRLGYIHNIPKAADKRHRELLLTERGADAMAATSVLDSSRIMRLLGKLSADEREAAVAGLRLLAHAARKLKEDEDH